jgi:hypothetical protein
MCLGFNDPDFSINCQSGVKNAKAICTVYDVSVSRVADYPILVRIENIIGPWMAYF